MIGRTDGEGKIDKWNRVGEGEQRKMKTKWTGRQPSISFHMHPFVGWKW